MKHILWWAILLALMIAASRAENWPRFRGPTGQGISQEKTVPWQWSGHSNVLWKTPIPGEGWSSPIVWGDRVYVTSATEQGVSCRVFCLGRDQGNILWETEALQQVLRRKESKNSYATPTPVTDGSRIYAVFGDGSIAAMELDGSVAWVFKEIKHYSQHGLGASPFLYKDLLIMSYDGSSEGPDKALGWQKPWDKALILALDKNTGEVKWKANRGLSRIAHVTSAIGEVNGQEQLISGAGDVIQGFDLATGLRIWSFSSPGEGVVPSIVVGDGLIFTASGFPQPVIRAVRPERVGDVTRVSLAWEQKKGAPTMSSYVYAAPYLYAITADGLASCLQADSGQIIWQEKLRGHFSASPVYAAGRVYFLSEEGETVVVASGASFNVLARNVLSEKCQASIAVSSGCLFIRTESSLYCIGNQNDSE